MWNTDDPRLLFSTSEVNGGVGGGVVTPHSSISVSMQNRCVQQCHRPFDFYMRYPCLRSFPHDKSWLNLEILYNSSTQWEMQWMHALTMVFLADICPLSVAKQPWKPNSSLISLYDKGLLHQSHKGVNAGTVLINRLLVQLCSLPAFPLFGAANCGYL